MITKSRAENIAKDMYQTVFRFVFSKPEMSEHDAEEVTQETFLLFYQKLEILDDSMIDRWLVSVASKKCSELYRRNKKKELFVSMEELFNSWDDVLITVDNMYNVSDEDIRKSLDVILKTLNKEEYELYYKKYVERKNHAQIAEEMGITADNVGTRAFRLRKKLERLAKLAFTGFGQFIIRTFF